MVLKRFIVYDSKGDFWSAPFYAPSKQLGIRLFASAVNDKRHDYGKHPADYQLFMNGEYDQQTGFSKDELADNLGLGVQFVEASTSFHQALEQLMLEHQVSYADLSSLFAGEQNDNIKEITNG